jgi:hypothetical protein
MKNQANREPKTEAVYLAARALKRVVKPLSKATGYWVIVILVTMMTGRLVASKGSLARAVQPLVWGVKWGWNRAHRAMERGKIKIDEMLEQMNEWCMSNLEVEEVKMGIYQREVIAVDTSTIARLRSSNKLELGAKEYWTKIGKAVKCNVVAVASKIVIIKGIRVGLSYKVKMACSAESAIEEVFGELRETPRKKLILVDAGIATKEEFSKATEKEALLGRLRINQKMRCAPIKIKGRRGRPPLHGDIIHPGRNVVEVKEDEIIVLDSPEGKITVRRWNNLHFEKHPKVKIDVLRVDDPKYKKPLVVGTTARELTTEEFYASYPMRWPIETLFFVGQDSCAMDCPRAWTKNAIESRVGLSLLASSLLQSIAASCEVIAIGPWDTRPTASAGRLAKFLDLYSHSFLELSLEGLPLRNYSKIKNTGFFNNLRNLWAA